MLDKMMLNGDDEPNLADNMQELRAAMDMAKKPSGRLAGTREDLDQLQQAVDLQSMLIRCADAVADNDRRRVAELLQRIRRARTPRSGWHTASPRGCRCGSTARGTCTTGRRR